MHMSLGLIKSQVRRTAWADKARRLERNETKKSVKQRERERERGRCEKRKVE